MTSEDDQDAQEQPSIRQMDDVLASQVAAGEVVERPASVVKELVENSIDAGARCVRVEIRRGGVSLLRVADDGCGMSRADAALCLLRHATSKLKSFEDLFDIRQLGFRGEALPSIASVSRLRLVTRRERDVEGTLVTCEGGRMGEPESCGCAPGTEIVVSDLFYNTPVRRKFLKSDETESGHVEHQLRLHALAFPQVRFTFAKDGRSVFDLPATSDARQRIAAFAGRELAAKLMRIRPTEAPGVQVDGFLLPLSEARRNRRMQYIFLNGRPVEDVIVARAIRDGYGGCPTGLHPALFLYLAVDPGLVDVNVHPAKREVRFRRPSDVTTAVIDAIAGTLAAHARGASPQGGEGPAESPAAPLPVSPPSPPSPAPTEEIRRPSLPADDALRRQPDGGEPPKRPAFVLRPVLEPQQGNLNLPSAVPPQDAPAPSDASPAAPLRDDFRVIGSLAEQYALFESREGLVLLAPRAALERIIFERLNAAAKKPVLSQKLLMPSLVELDARDMGAARAAIPQLERAGFRLSVFGGNTLRVESVPAFLRLREVETFMQEFFASAASRGDTRRSRNPYEPVVRQLAQQYARQEDVAPLLANPLPLLSSLLNCEIPYCTPGGKPTLVPISLAELNRKFQAL